MKTMIRLLLCFTLFCAAVTQAQLLANTQVSLTDGSILTMQLTHNGVQQLSGDAYDAYMKIQGIGDSGSTNNHIIDAEALPLTPSSVPSNFSLIAASLLAGVAVYGQTTTVANAKAVAAQVAGAQLVFTKLQPPSTPPPPAQIQAMESLALGFISLAGGSPPQVDVGGSVVEQLLQGLNLPFPCQ